MATHLNIYERQGMKRRIIGYLNEKASDGELLDLYEKFNLRIIPAEKINLRIKGGQHFEASSRKH